MDSQKPKAEFIPGWACDGRECAAIQNDVPGQSTKETLERADWLVEAVHGVVIRAWCPHCRRGRTSGLR